jgi:hypothetical protein
VQQVGAKAAILLIIAGDPFERRLLLVREFGRRLLCRRLRNATGRARLGGSIRRRPAGSVEIITSPSGAW